MGDSRSKSAILGSNVPNSDVAFPSLASGASGKAGKGIVEGTLQAGTSAVYDKLLDLVGLGGKSGADKRKDTRFFFSSRRRHTRSVSAFLLNRSSDLGIPAEPLFRSEHGTMFTLALVRFPPTATKEIQYLNAKGALTYTDIAGDPVLYGNLPPREISMKDVFRSGDSSKKFKIAEGQWYRYAPS